MARYRASSSIDRRRYATSVRMHGDDVAKPTDKGKGKASMMSAIVVPALEDATHQRPPTMTLPRKRSSILHRASTTSSNESSEASTWTSSSSSLCTCWSRQVSFSTRRGGSVAGAPPKSGAANRFPREGAAYRCSADQRDADPDREERAGGDAGSSDDEEPAFASTTTPSRPTTGPTTRRIRSGYDTRLGSYDPFDAARSLDRVTSADLSAASSTSPLPLSPSRPPLFDDSDEDDDDNETSRIYYLCNTDDEDNEDDDVLCTPTSAGSGPVRRISLGLIREPVKSMAVNDPLLSPPPPLMPILTFGKQGPRSAWLPASPLTTALVSPTTTPPTITTATSPPFPAFLSTSPTSMTSSTLKVEHIRSTSGGWDPAVSGGTTSKPLSPVSPPPITASTTMPKVSLLTKSLRSLAISLPNLQLPGLRPPLLSLDLEGLDVGERAPWNRPRRASFGAVDSSLAIVGATPGVESRAENPDEVLTMFQLQTFSVPSLASSVNARKYPASGSGSGSADHLAMKKSAVPASPVPTVTMPRYVSNQRHLLMLSLELEMMRRHKISAPLRGRAVVVRATTPPPSSSSSSNPIPSGGSGLRWEVMPAV